MIKIMKPGLLTSVQDLGRYKYQKYGVIVSGAMDTLSHRIANLLVGNQENAATLEITLLGPVIEFEEDTLISICGGDLSPAINGEPIRLWRSIFVKKGSLLSFGACKNGCRAYLAVAGGFKISNVMESKSTYLRAGIGGFKGRALRSGDRLDNEEPSNLSAQMINRLKNQLGETSFIENDWTITSDLIPSLQSSPTIRAIKGRQYHLFTEQSKDQFLTELFEVTAQSDRMGYRLKGPFLELGTPTELLSEAVNFGSIQVPPEGNPIVLLADRQTTGGYPKIAQIAFADIPLMAQLKPGDSLRFALVTYEEAERLFIEREMKLQQLKQGIILKYL
ncbi:MAG TPA: biotin-dependent carboxyltransferase family protein [Bacillus sp. (in: firmicutes)]|nr:biotin-dependent carboxyltransferase family protein [Bacillus sp. (in: firmicutes)]